MSVMAPVQASMPVPSNDVLAKKIMFNLLSVRVYEVANNIVPVKFGKKSKIKRALYILRSSTYSDSQSGISPSNSLIDFVE